MKIEDLVQKIQNLISNRRMGSTSEEDKDIWQVIRFRDSFRHKLNAAYFHFNLVRQIKKDVQFIIEKDMHGKGQFLIGDDNIREKIDLTRQVQFKCTVLVEDILYHITSTIDNLPKIISVYYRTVDSGEGFRTARKQLNHEHTKDLEITHLINKDWDEWIEKTMDFRGEIFHHHSKTVEASRTTSFGKNDDGSQYFNEDIVVVVPEKLRLALGFQRDKVEIEEFCTAIFDKMYSFCNGLFDILISEHEKISRIPSA